MWIFWSILLGIGLAMDAFAVSIANGLNDDKLKRRMMVVIALFFGVFQAGMPLIGYLAGTLFERFNWFKYVIPGVGFTILMILGIKSIVESFKKEEEKEAKKLTILLLFIQALATSIDALTVGIGIDNTISATASYQVYICIAIIGVVTFVISYVGCVLGKKFKDIFSSKAALVGGIILIAIAIKILVEFLISLF